MWIVLGGPITLETATSALPKVRRANDCCVERGRKPPKEAVKYPTRASGINLANPSRSRTVRIAAVREGASSGRETASTPIVLPWSLWTSSFITSLPSPSLPPKSAKSGRRLTGTMTCRSLGTPPVGHSRELTTPRMAWQMQWIARSLMVQPNRRLASLTSCTRNVSTLDHATDFSRPGSPKTPRLLEHSNAAYLPSTTGPPKICAMSHAASRAMRDSVRHAREAAVRRRRPRPRRFFAGACAPFFFSAEATISPNIASPSSARDIISPPSATPSASAWWTRNTTSVSGLVPPARGGNSSTITSH
mmetsp:Transcript_7043/g.17767  ORF Transcript_7043/g.17767 Transcript_7043/m.17767 type:complete len:305 (-) Transcript_7043:468-1382(-)